MVHCSLSGCVHMRSIVSVVSDFLQPYRLQPTRLHCPWDSPGRNTRVGCHALLQGIFSTQGWNLYLFCLPHCRRILYPLSHLGNPRPLGLISQYSNVFRIVTCITNSLLVILAIVTNKAPDLSFMYVGLSRCSQWLSSMC